MLFAPLVMLAGPKHCHGANNFPGNSNRHLSQSSTQSSNSHSNVSASSSSNYGSGVGSLRSVAGSSISSIESHPRNYQRVARNTPRNSLYQQPLSDNKPDDDSLNPLPTPQCSYWCTVCKYPRRFQTCGGWIKHEKEDHEGTVYVCMPDGPTSFTQHGLICVLCGSPNPDEKHMETHNIASCMDKGLTARTYKRKYQILKHLESHMVPKGSDVASGWRRRCNKKAWACGLCVAYFAKATDRFHHIATQHYERGEGIDKWDTSKVILGLLQQSRLHRAWTERLQFQFPDGEIPDLRWDKNPNGSLITMLELGLLATEDPQPLAMEAFLQSDYSQACHQTQSISAVPPPISEGSPKEKTSEIVQDSHRPSDNTHGLGPHVPVKGEIFVAPLFRVQSFSQPGNFLWPDPMLFDPNDALDCEMDNASSSLAYMTTSYNEGLTEVEPSNLPASRDDSGRRQSQDNLPLNSRSLSLSPQTERVHSKFATDRPMSSMEIDTDLESLTRALLNEQARHEAQMNRWDTNLS